MKKYDYLIVGAALFSEVFVNELEDSGIRVNAIAPGIIETYLLKGISEEKIHIRIQLGRIGQPQDIANTSLNKF